MKKDIILDIDKCVGCGACAVACMDQNDTLIDGDASSPNRRICRAETGRFPEAQIRFASISCVHCAEPACVLGCPTGALTKDKATGAVVANPNLCIGCHSCALACPFGVPRYDVDDKITKCDKCWVRTQCGLLPACVKVCQTGALQYVEVDVLQAEKEERKYQRLLQG